MLHKSLNTATFIASGDAIDPDAPTILLIHGAGQSALLWQHQVKGLDFQGNILALDLPGHGNSTLAGHSRIKEYASWIMKFIKTAGLGRIIIGGLSMGGAIAQQLLIDASDRFSAGLLLDTGARLRVAPLFFNLLATNEHAWQDACYQYSTFSSNRSEGLRNVFDQVSDCPIDTTINDFLACDQFDVMASLNAISCPVLVLNGEHDQLTPPKYGRFLADRIPNAKLEIIADAGHFAPIEQPQTVNQCISAFLKGIKI